jgi:hypothetical protein
MLPPEELTLDRVVGRQLLDPVIGLVVDRHEVLQEVRGPNKALVQREDSSDKPN